MDATYIVEFGRNDKKMFSSHKTIRFRTEFSTAAKKLFLLLSSRAIQLSMTETDAYSSYYCMDTMQRQSYIRVTVYEAAKEILVLPNDHYCLDPLIYVNYI